MGFRDLATQALQSSVVVLTPDQTAFDTVLSTLRDLGVKPGSGGLSLTDSYNAEYKAIKISKTGLLMVLTFPEIRELSLSGKGGSMCSVEQFLALPLNELADVIFDNQANMTRRAQARDEVSALSSMLYGKNVQVSSAVLDALALLKTEMLKGNPELKK